MSRVSYFQRFSQRENHATNNTLLLLRHLYQSSPFKIGRVLTSLVETELSIGLTFEQQVKGDQSVPDALISQQPLSIFIETKRGEALDENQIRRHIETIAARSQGGVQAILLGLTREPIPPVQVTTLREEAAKRGVLFGAVTFSQVVEAVRAQCADYERDLLEMVEDYEQFLAEEGLLQTRNQRLVVFPCGQSFAENERFGLYYEPPTRPCKLGNRFIGIYRNKTVALVGVVDAVAVCSYRDGIVAAQVESGNFTEEYRERVKTVIEETHYYDLAANPTRFYLVSTFAPTDLKKESLGGLMGLRYLDLAALAPGRFDSHKAYTAIELADLLRGRTFE